MQGYLNKGKELLKILINNGFEGYFYGETVRNSIKGLDCDHVDIITSASVDELSRILVKYNFTPINKNSSYLNMDGYKFIISSFRDNVETSGTHSLQSKTTSKNLLDNLALCNFTINALAMSVSGKITDAYDGYHDIKKEVIKTVGPVKQRFFDNPEFMLQAITIVSEMNFKLHKTTITGIKKRLRQLVKIDSKKVATEMKRILAGRYAKKALILMNKLGMAKSMPIFSNTIKKLITYNKTLSFDELMICCFIQNKAIDENYIELCEMDDFVRSVYSLACANQNSKFDKVSLFSYGKEVCLEAYKINKILGRTKGNQEKKIVKGYDNLPIKKRCDLKFKGEDIMRISDLRNAEEIGDIFEDLVYQVLIGELKNDYNELEQYACDILKSKNIPYDTTRTTIKGIQPRINPVNNNTFEQMNNHTASHSEEMDNYNNFINNLNTNKQTSSAYWQNGIDNSRDDDMWNEKTELPNITRKYDPYNPIYDNDNSNKKVVDQYNDNPLNDSYNKEDSIDYSAYKDPTVPKNPYQNVYDDKPHRGSFSNSNYDSSSYDFDNYNNNNNQDDEPEVEMYYEHKLSDEADARIRLLEQRLNEQDRIIREKTHELEKQKILTIQNRVVDATLEQLNRTPEIAESINKADFANELSEFVNKYFDQKLPK